jgi:hypothetical protein
VRFDRDFESGSIGPCKTIGPDHYLCFVKGQRDQDKRNRQASWYYFSMSGIRGRDITLTFTNLVAERDGKPGAASLSADVVPVYSLDGSAWRHFPSMEWDEETQRATVRFRVNQNFLWIAHVPPYPLSRVEELLDEVAASPHAKVEPIGESVLGRDLRIVTVTDAGGDAAARPRLWLLARQHAWQTPTSHALEGALRFLVSDEPKARSLRKRFAFVLVPTMDPDGVSNGLVRYNAWGYDLDRHWDEVDPTRDDKKNVMPEIWHVKRRIWDELDAGHAIDLMVNLHAANDTEAIETQATDPAARDRIRRLHAALLAGSAFDPTSEPIVRTEPIGDTNVLARQRGVPVARIDLRIGTGKKLGRRPTVDDCLKFGRDLVVAMAASAPTASPTTAPSKKNGSDN